MTKTFEMVNLGLMYYFMRIEINQNDEGIFIFQKKYTKYIIKKIKMSGYKTVTTLLDRTKALKKEDSSPLTNNLIFEVLFEAFYT